MDLLTNENSPLLSKPEEHDNLPLDDLERSHFQIQPKQADKEEEEEVHSSLQRPGRPTMIEQVLVGTMWILVLLAIGTGYEVMRWQSDTNGLLITSNLLRTPLELPLGP